MEIFFIAADIGLSWPRVYFDNEKFIEIFLFDSETSLHLLTVLGKK